MTTIFGHAVELPKYETEWIVKPFNTNILNYLYCRFDNKIITAENITFTKNQVNDNNFKFTALFHYDHNAYHIRDIINKITSEYPNIKKIDLEVWFTVLTCYKPFIEKYEELSFEQHRLLDFRFIDKYPIELSENDKRIIAKSEVDLDILLKLMEKFNVIDYIKKYNLDAYNEIKSDIARTKYAKEVVNDILPKKGNRVKWCIKTKNYNLLQFIDSKKEFDECSDILVKEIPKLLGGETLSKEIIEKIDQFIEWNEYGTNPSKLQYTIKKPLHQYLTINTNIEVFRLLKKHNLLNLLFSIDVGNISLHNLEKYADKLKNLNEIFNPCDS
jgi:hypothetical protein